MYTYEYCAIICINITHTANYYSRFIKLFLTHKLPPSLNSPLPLSFSPIPLSPPSLSGSLSLPPPLSLSLSLARSLALTRAHAHTQ